MQVMTVGDLVTRPTKSANAAAPPGPPLPATHWSNTVSSTLTMVYCSSGGRPDLATLPRSKRLAEKKVRGEGGRDSEGEDSNGAVGPRSIYETTVSKLT